MHHDLSQKVMRSKEVSVKIFPFKEYGYGINFWVQVKAKLKVSLSKYINGK